MMVFENPDYGLKLFFNSNLYQFCVKDCPSTPLRVKNPFYGFFTHKKIAIKSLTLAVTPKKLLFTFN